MVVVEFVGQAHEKIPSLLVFAFAVEATALEDSALHLNGRATVAADAVQIRLQFPWPGNHEREEKLLAVGWRWGCHRLVLTSGKALDGVNSFEGL